MSMFTKTKNYKDNSKKGKKKPSMKEDVKKIVKAEIARNIEDKCVNYFSTGSFIYPSSAGATFSNSVVPISPSAAFLVIPQGTGQGQRIGNEIKIKNVNLRGTIFPTQYNISTNPAPVPQRIIFWFLYDKTATTLPPNLTNTDVLQLGNTSAALQNSIMDAWSPFNSDRYTVLHKKVFKLGYATSGGTGNIAASQSFTNNDFKFNCDFNFDLTKYVVKHIKYNDAVNNLPTTRGLFWAFTTVASNGATFASNGIPAEMEYSLNMTYEDA